MAISEVIQVDAGPAIDQLNALAEAAARAEAAVGKIKAKAPGVAGIDRLAAAYDKAATSIAASIGKISAAQDKLATMNAGATSAASGLAKVGDAAKTSAGGVDALGASAGKTDAGLKGLGASGTTAADGIKGVGTSAKESGAFLAEYTATMKAAADTQRQFAAISADTSAKVATSQRLQTAMARDASAGAIAQQKAQARAAQDAAAAAEATQHRWNNAGLAGLAIAGYGVDRAARLQAGVTRLYTTAGESKKNLPTIEQGILRLAPQTATSQADLLQGAYMAESAGFHGKNALSVLKAGAEGAFAEGAPLGDTINALTSLMNAYGLRGAKAPTAAMDQIIAMVSRGKMTMAGAVSALPTVLPTAASAGLNFGQVGGALATMTAMGASPDLAAQHLTHTIGSLQSMSGVQTTEIQQLGGDPVKLQKNLGKTGLLGTLTDINKLVMGSMGKSGLVMMKTFNQSASAAADANKMLNALPPSVKGVAKAYADGSISAKQWNKEIFSGSESAQNKNLLLQFSAVENKARGFSDLLKSGSPAAQTYQAALSKALGGQTGLQTFLQLMGVHQGTTAANTAAVTGAGKHPAADITGWGDVKKTLKFQLGSAEQGLESAATQLGKAFLPIATTGLKDLANVGKFFAQHPTVTKDLGVAGAGILGVKFGAQLAGAIGKALHIPGLSNLGKGTGLDAAAAGLKGAAADLSAAAERLGGAPGVPGGKPGEPGVPGGVPGRAAPAVENAAERTAPFTLGMFAPVGIGIAGGVFVAQYANQFRKYDHPAPAGQFGPRSYGSPALTAGSNAWKQYDAPAPKVNAAPVTAATAQIAHAMERDLHTPVKVAAPDLSGLASARGKARANAEALTHALETALHKPVKLTAPDLSAAQGAVGKARADGANISAGLASGIEAGKGAVVAAAADVANAAAAAMAHAVQSHSPSKKTQKIGADTAQGFVVGLEGGKDAVDAAATAIGKHAAKAADITSIDNTVKKLLADVKGDSGLTRMLKADQSKLTSLANQRSKLEAEITNATDIAQNAISGASIMNAAGATPYDASQAPSSYAIVQGQQAQAANLKAFVAAVAKDKSLGLNATSLSQIVQAGPDQGLGMAQGIASGGKSAVKQLNQLQAQIHASAAKLGSEGAGPMYQAGQDAAHGLAAGLKAGLGSVESEMKHLADAMVAEVRKDLKSHSPSLVMQDIGIGIPQGLGMGVDRGTPAALSAMNRMGSHVAAWRPAAGAGHPAAGGSYGGGGGNITVQNHYTVTVQVHGSVMSEHDLAATVSNALLKRGANNWQSGLVLPGRAV